MIEPSDQERAELPEATARYLQHLEELVSAGESGLASQANHIRRLESAARQRNLAHAAGSTRLYIDCEWNGYRGELISMALVAANGKSFYAEFRCVWPIKPWVAENVVPKLVGDPISRPCAQVALTEFLAEFESIHIVADWPEDIERFCEMLILGPGQRIDTPPMTMEVVREDAESEYPHFAPADARGLMKHMEALRPTPSQQYREVGA